MSKFEKGKSGNPRGRPPGSANKVPAILKEAILAGGEEGLTGLPADPGERKSVSILRPAR